MAKENADEKAAEEADRAAFEAASRSAGVGVVKDPRAYLLQALTNGECGRMVSSCPLRVLREIQDAPLIGSMIRGLSLSTARRMLKTHFTCSGGLRDAR